MIKRLRSWFARREVRIGVELLWITALMVYVLAGTSLVPFHGDESTQIMMSRDVYYILQGDGSRLLYQVEPPDATEQHLRLLNGTLPKYLIGLAALAGGYGSDDLNDQWLWGADWAWNVTDGHMPSDGLLLAARWSSAILAALSVPAMFGLGWLWRGRRAAYAASLILALHPVVLIQGRRAYMEGALLFFSVLAILIAVAWGQRLTRPVISRRAMWGGALGLGVAAGLLVASKHSGAAVAAAAYGGVGLAILWQRFPMRRTLRLLAALATSGIVALAVFLALNPAWWSDPVARVGEVLDLRQGLVTDQVAAFPESVYPDTGARLGGMLRELSVAPPVYFEAPWWAGYPELAAQIETYRASPWAGIQTGTNGLTTAIGVGLLLFTLMGCVPVAEALRRGQAAGWAIGLWALLNAAAILISIPLAWQRYAMPLYPVQAILAAAGFDWLAGRIATMRQRPAPARV